VRRDNLGGIQELTDYLSYLVFFTVVGPGLEERGGSARMVDLVLPYDAPNSTNWLKFKSDIHDRMRDGMAYYSAFWRTKSDNVTQEELYMAFAPIMMRTYKALNHSNFSAGIESRVSPIYSLGFGITLKDLEIRFVEVEEQVKDNIEQVTYISLALIIGAVLMVMYMTYTMTIYLARPILCLVGIVKSISSKTIEDELPQLEGGSCEIKDVYDSLEKLCKIVRFSNAAFFKGDRAKSYKVLEEALELFNNMNNQKAVGVANNNLGTMVLQEQMERSSTTARSAEVFQTGTRHVHENQRSSVRVNHKTHIKLLYLYG
jgi:hypothetical protein